MNNIPQLTVIIALAALTVSFIARKTDDTMRPRMIILFLAVFIGEIILSLFLYEKTVYTKYYGFSYMGDDYIYGDFGTIVGDLWRRGIFMPLKKLEYFNLIGPTADLQEYQLYNAFIFFLFGPRGGQILLIINCFLHAAIIVPVYFVLRGLGIRSKVITFTFILFLFWPSVFYWSLFNFKDPMILFVLFSIFAVLFSMREKAGAGKFILLLLLSFILYFLKHYLIVIFPVAFIYLLWVWKWKYKIHFILLLLFFAAAAVALKSGYFSGLYARLDNVPYEIFGIRYSGRFDNTSYFSNLLTFTYPRMLLYLPFGGAAALFLPFLLRPFTLFQVAANIESIMWWCFLPFLFHGLWLAAVKEFKKLFPMLAMFLLWFMMLALSQGNMGTLLRQKAIIYYTGFIFIALSIDRTIASLEDSPGRQGK